MQKFGLKFASFGGNRISFYMRRLPVLPLYVSGLCNVALQRIVASETG